MKILRNLIICSSLLLLGGWLGAAEPTLGDFMTPAKDGAKAPSSPKQPGKVKKSTEALTKDGKSTTVIHGVDMQDAAVATSQALEEEEQEIMIFKAPGAFTILG